MGIGLLFADYTQTERGGIMVKQDLESFSTDELKKKRKFASLVLGILAGVLLVNITVAILKGTSGLFAIAAALVASGLPMFMELKRLNGELERRENS